jgi:predicted O-methyltransferase YrrM
MKYEQIITLLKTYSPPPGWPGNMFLLPEEVMCEIYRFIVDKKLHTCIELGTGFGSTSCVMAAALDEIGGGRLVTVDMYLHQPVNVKVLAKHTEVDTDSVDVIVDRLGYNWYLSELIQHQTENGICKPLFDFCLLDGAHEWEPDALAFYLIAKLMKPGAWIAIDDLNFNLRMIPNWQETHGNYTDRELDAFQMAMVYELVVKQHPDFENFDVTHFGRIGWAQKKLLVSDRKPHIRLPIMGSFRYLLKRFREVTQHEGLGAVLRKSLRYLRKRLLQNNP